MKKLLLSFLSFFLFLKSGTLNAQTQRHALGKHNEQCLVLNNFQFDYETKKSFSKKNTSLNQSYLKAYGKDLWTVEKTNDEEISVITYGVLEETGLFAGYKINEIYINIIDPNGITLEEQYFNYSSWNDHNLTPYKIPASSPKGTYTIEVTPYLNGYGAYEIIFESNGESLPFERKEHPIVPNKTLNFNDNFPTSDTWSKTINDSFSIGDDIHSWEVYLNEGEEVDINLKQIPPFPNLYFGPTALEDTMLFILDHQGNILDFNDDLSERNLSASITFKAPKKGSYFVIATLYPKISRVNWRVNMFQQANSWELGDDGIMYYELAIKTSELINREVIQKEISENAIKINAIVITSDSTLQNLPISEQDIDNQIKELNIAYEDLYDGAHWPSFELATITKVHSAKYANFGNPKYEVMNVVGNSNLSKKGYINVIYYNISQEANLMGATQLYGDLNNPKGVRMVVNSTTKDSGFVLTHEMGHVIGSNHLAGMGWPPPYFKIGLEDNSKMGYTPMLHSATEYNYMGAWFSNSYNYFIPNSNLYLTNQKLTFNSPSHGNFLKKLFRSWLISNGIIDQNTPKTSYEGNDPIINANNSWERSQILPDSNNYIFSNISASQKENRETAYLFVDSNTSKVMFGTFDKNLKINRPSLSTHGAVGQTKMNSKGDALLITEPWYDNTLNVLYKSSTDSNWSSELKISNSESIRSRTDLALNEKGDAVIAWVEWDLNKQNNVLKLKELVNGSWQDEIIISEEKNLKELPAVTYNDRGDVLISWQQWPETDAYRYEVVGKFRSGKTGEWSLVETYSEEEYNAGSVQVALDEIGNGLIYFRQQMSEYSSQLYIRYRNKNGSLEPLKQISPEGEDALNSSVEIKNTTIEFKNGIAAVSWWGVHQNRNVIYASIMHEKNIWEKTRLTEPGKSASLPSLSIGNDGKIAFSWQRSDGLNLRVQSRFYNFIDRSWSETFTISDPGFNAIHPDISSTYNSGAIASWSQYNPEKFAYEAQIKEYISKKKTPEIIFENIIKNYGDPDFEINSSSNSRGDISYKIANPKVASLSSSNTISLKSIGETTIYLYQKSDEDYNSAIAKIRLKVNGDPEGDLDGDGILNKEDLCPNSPSGSTVSISGCEIFSLPSNNYKIKNTASSCIGANNGSLSIEISDNSYEYIIEVPELNASYSINAENGHKLILDELNAGLYTLVFKVVGQDAYTQIFEAQITEPAPLQAKTNFDLNGKSGFIALAGADTYFIEVNGQLSTISENLYHLDLKPGLNTIKVSTPLDCQGVFQKEIFIAESLTYYPNPVTDVLHVIIPGKDAQVAVRIFTDGGQKIMERQEEVSFDRSILLNLNKLNSGVYIVNINGKSVHKEFKIIKK